MDDLGDLFKWAAAALLAAWVGLASWIGTTQVKRIDALEREKASRASTDARFDRVMATLEEHDKKDDVAHALLLDKLHELGLAVARLETKLEADD